MNLPNFKWNRRWLKQAERYTANEPAADNASRATLRFDEIEAMPCLVLLGSPGMGKTHELKKAFDAARDSGQAAEYVSLRSIRGPQDLQRAIGSGRNLLAEVGVFGIYLDGLDEAAVPIGDLFEWIVAELKKLIVSRPAGTTYLRLSSRHAVWLSTYEDDLRRIFGERNVGAFELCPLTAEDLEAAIESLSGAPLAQNIVDRIRGAYSDALFRLPITFLMLVEIFLSGGDLPTRRIEIYRRALLTTIDLDQGSSKASASLSGEERLLIAARLATCAVLSNRHTIWTGLYAGLPPGAVLAIQEVAGGEEEYLGSSFRVTEAEMRQIVETGLFLRTGPNLYTWTHLSFAEFLAGYYLASRLTSVDDLLGILSIDAKNEQRLAPQMKEVAAWTAAMMPELFNRLLAKEPLLLLNSDAFTGDASATAALVDELFQALEDHEEYGWYRDVSTRLTRLAHPGLANQLSRILVDASRKSITRSIALQIAAANMVEEVASTALEIAKNGEAEEDERVDAINLLVKAGSPLLGELTDVLTGEGGALSDNLRGALLQALYPKYLTHEQLFGALAPANTKGNIGAYSLFLNRLEFGPLNTAGAVAAVNWVRDFVPDNYTSIYFKQLFDAALVSAWRQIEQPAVLDAFASLFATSARSFYRLTHDMTFVGFRSLYHLSTPDLRKALLLKMQEHADDGEFDRAIAAPWQLIDERDLDWLLKELVSSNPLFPSKWLIAAVFWITSGKSPDEIAFLWDFAEINEELAFSLEGRFSSDLSSQMAAWEREDFLRKTNRKIPAPRNVRGQVLKLIQEAKANSFLWWRLNLALLDSDDPLEIQTEFTSDLSDSSYWKDASVEQRAELVALAKSYLKENNVPLEECIKPNVFHRPAAAGLRAIRLLRDFDAESYESLPDDVWARWMPALLTTSTNESLNAESARVDIVRRAYSEAPAAFISVLESMIAENIHPYDLPKLLGGAVDTSLAEVLWKYVPKNDMDGHARDSMLRSIVVAGFAPAIEFLKNGLEVIAAGRSLSADDRQKIGILLSAELEVDADAIWRPFMAAIAADREFSKLAGDKVVNRVSFGEVGFLPQLTPGQVGEMYDWIGSLYPHDPDREEGDGTVTSWDLGSRIQERLLSYLMSLGTEEGVSELERVERQYPSLPWIRWYRRQGEERLFRAEWHWPQPREVLERIMGRASLPSNDDQELLIRSISSKAAALANPETRIPDAGTASITTEVPHVKIEQAGIERPRRILLVATEWSSGHGGVSSINRNLAVALARIGHEVACLVPTATQPDLDFANRDRVNLIAVGKRTGFDNDMLLASFDPAAEALNPEFVIGHDHVTGPVARLITEKCQGARYVHMIHTIPNEIEPYKLAEDGQSRKFVRGEEKAKDQLEFCRAAALVVAVGPRIRNELLSNLSDRPGLIHELRPGLEERLLQLERPLPVTGLKKCLFLGRQEDPELKGLAVAGQMLNLIAADVAFSNSRELKLIIRGVDSDHSDKRITELCEKYKIPPHQVVPRSYSADTADLDDDFKSASVLIMPSRVEGFGLVALEAISAGIPVLIGQESGIVLMLSELDGQQSGKLAGWKVRTLTVGIDDAINGQNWASAIHKVLEDRDSAFREAGQYRRDLGHLLTWRDAAMKLSSRLEQMP